jgi:putative PIG3 family NAD(P)H quinone oxidoreductase
MRAVVVPSPGRDAAVVVAELDDPVPGPGEVLVEVHAAALNRADLMQRAGAYPPPPGASDVLGLEVAGVVRALGAGVSGVAVGERVCALLAGGGYAELAVVPAALLMRIPERLGFVEAAAVPEVFLTAYSALFWEGRALPGETVLIHAGASGVGTAAIQLARRRGCRVFVTAGGPAKGRACRELGAELAVDRYAEDFERAVLDFVGEAAPGATVGQGGAGPPGPVDVAIDMVGRDYFERNLRLLALRGRLVFLAAQSGADVPLRITALMAKRLQLVGATLRARPIEEKAALTRAFVEDFGDELASGAIRPVVDSTYPLERVDEAHARMAANANVGKIVLVVRGE